jgi:hypothetical protein
MQASAVAFRLLSEYSAAKFDTVLRQQMRLKRHRYSQLRQLGLSNVPPFIARLYISILKRWSALHRRWPR